MVLDARLGGQSNAGNVDAGASPDRRTAVRARTGMGVGLRRARPDPATIISALELEDET
jgi:hypothetical protein